ncbi:MAG: beta-lactamase family protein [Bacteroidia bacterium]|nr:beta-lactamase family protein [Bacteroidia bacterium]
MRKFFLILFFFLIGSAMIIKLSGNEHIYRTLAMTIFRFQMGPQIDELEDFPSRQIAAGNPEPWPVSAHFGSAKPLPDFLNKAISYKTTALVLIQNDSLLYEQYFDGYDKDRVSNSFSMAKSFTSLLIGKAIQEGLIKDIDAPIGQYLQDFKNAPYDKISIRHLLTMSSGLDFKESYGSLFGWPAKAYYGTDVNATVYNAPKLYEPGTIYEYKGGDTQLLGMILAEVIKPKKVSEYASELWRKIGAESNAFWSLDSENGMEKVSCCYYANARDFARFGKLLLQKGKWNNEQLIDSNFIEASIKPGNNLTKAGNTNTEYGFQWWLLNYKGKTVWYARGIKGQYLFCLPNENLILVRLGHFRAEKKGDEIPQDVFDYLDLALSTQ